MALLPGRQVLVDRLFLDFSVVRLTPGGHTATYTAPVVVPTMLSCGFGDFLFLILRANGRGARSTVRGWSSQVGSATALERVHRLRSALSVLGTDG